MFLGNRSKDFLDFLHKESWRYSKKIVRPILKKKWVRDLGDGSQKRPFLVLLEFEPNDFAENLSKVSSTKDLSNRIGHAHRKMVLAPLVGHIPF